MSALEQQNWIERLIRENAALERVMNRQTEQLAAKDAEIAELKAGILNNWGKTIHNATPQPAQEQADEHPVKKGFFGQLREVHADIMANKGEGDE